MPKIETEASILEEALALQALGLWVVPQDGRRAVVLGWPDHRLDEADLQAYLSNGRLNIAVVLSRSDFMDVECDTAEGEAKIKALCSVGQLETPTWRSRRGLHRLYLRPPGLPPKAKVEVEGIEFRIGNNPALSTLPPSVHPDDGSVYAWLPERSIHEMRPAPLPKPLLELVLKGVRSGRARQADEAKGVIAEGRRNDELHRYGCRLVRFGHKAEDIRNALIGCNKDQCRPPLPDVEVEGILRSVGETAAKQAAAELGPRRCESWHELWNAWKDALSVTASIKQALAVMLAVALSTEQQGDSQLFLQVIADAGSAKTKLCDAMLVSKTNCIEVEHVTGFHSGWKDGSGKDFSFLARANKKTWITPEGDVLMSNPKAQEIMSQQRRIFDGSSSAIYKNQDSEQRHEGLRTPWIIAGTPALLSLDQARLGDRFVRIIIDPPTDDERDAILDHVGFAAFRSVKVRSNCTSDSILEESLREAYRLTGGYVDYLRANAEELLERVVAATDERAALDRCVRLAEFTAAFRARPDPNPRNAEKHDTSELPTRLVAQFVRLACCLTAVMQKPSMDDEVLAVVRKVALDTARGRTLTLARLLLEEGEQGLEARTVAGLIGETEEKAVPLLRFLRRVGVAEHFTPTTEGVIQASRWRLTERLAALCREVL